MYSEIGSKIKGLAKLQGYLGAALSIIVFFALSIKLKETFEYAWVENPGWKAFFISLIAAVFVFIFMWTATWVIYGFGTLVTNSEFQTLLLKRQNLNAAIHPGGKTEFTEDELKKFENENDYFCKSCGNAGPYNFVCPECGSHEKMYRRDFVNACYCDERERKIYFRQKQDGDLICPKCSTWQPAGSACTNCGYRFVYESKM